MRRDRWAWTAGVVLAAGCSRHNPGFGVGDSGSTSMSGSAASSTTEPDPGTTDPDSDTGDTSTDGTLSAGVTGTTEPPVTTDTSTGEPDPDCGDGEVDPGLGEQCDDGNTRAGDECEPNCRRLFAEPVVKTTQLALTGIAAADFDMDGKVDLALSRKDEGVAEVLVLFNDGAGEFFTEGAFGAELPTTGVAAADLDGDGKPDVVASQVNGAIIARRQGPTGFNDGGIDLLNAEASDGRSLLLTDLNDDDVHDVLIAAPGQSRVYAGIGMGGGVFVKPMAELATSFDPERMAVGRLDGDDKADLAVSYTKSGAGYVALMFDVTLFNEFDDTVQVGESARGLAIHDLGLPGPGPDILVTDPVGGALWVLTVQGDGYVPLPSVAVGPEPGQVLVGAFRGADTTDIVTLNRGNGRVAAALFDGELPDQVPDFTAVEEPVGMVAADFDGDGVLDLAVASGFGDVAVLRNQSAD